MEYALASPRYPLSTTIMKTCYGYTRVSTQKQGEGVSLVAQKEAITNYAAANSIHVSHWFEETETAAKAGRPLFTKMVKELNAGKASGVVIHKIDRSARNFRDWARIGELADQGVEIHFVTESLDFQSRGGRLAADIQAVIAADYIRNLRDETIKGIRGRLRQGLLPGPAPLGYLDNGGGKVKTLDPARAPLISEAFNLYASGQYSLRTLRHELNAMGLHNRNSGPVSKNSISNILHNPFYHGIVRSVNLGEEHKGKHQALVSKELFDRVQDVLAEKTTRKTARHDHRYRGLFRCELCNAPMTPELQKGHVYYRCHTQLCPTKCIREEALTEAVQEKLADVRLPSIVTEAIRRDLETWFANLPTGPSPVSSASFQLGQINARLQKATDALIDGRIEKEEFDLRKDELECRRTELAQVLRNLGDAPTDRDRFEAFSSRIDDFPKLIVQMTPREVREFLPMVLPVRTFSEQGAKIEVFLPDDFQARYQLLLRRVFHRLN
jgi:site-specific DNA recombinase